MSAPSSEPVPAGAAARGVGTGAVAGGAAAATSAAPMTVPVCTDSAMGRLWVVAYSPVTGSK